MPARPAAVVAALRRERGQTTTEFMGMILVIAAMVGVIATSDIDGQIARNVSDQICRVLGDSCATKDDDSKVAKGSDSDRDGLSDREEKKRNTLPGRADTDGDGLIDGDEVRRGTNPLESDSDDDGVPDGREVKDKTDPRNGSDGRRLTAGEDGGGAGGSEDLTDPGSGQDPGLGPSDVQRANQQPLGSVPVVRPAVATPDDLAGPCSASTAAPCGPGSGPDAPLLEKELEPYDPCDFGGGVGGAAAELTGAKDACEALEAQDEGDTLKALGHGLLSIPVIGKVRTGGKAAKEGVEEAIEGLGKKEAKKRTKARKPADGTAPRTKGGAPANCLRNSFSGATPVLMADGSTRPISTIAPGQRVVATNPATGETAPRSVTHLIVGEGPKTLVRLRVGGAVTTATDRHPFWVEARSAWVAAVDVHPGDRLRGPGGTLVGVTGVRVLSPERARVFNVTVAGLHTYYAGREPVLVHNAHCQPPESPPGIPGLERARGKTTVRGGGHPRRRWKDRKGNIYEWDYRHGRVEKYDKRGRHRGEFDPDTGEQIKPPVPGRRVEP